MRQLSHDLWQSKLNFLCTSSWSTECRSRAASCACLSNLKCCQMNKNEHCTEPRYVSKLQQALVVNGGAQDLTHSVHSRLTGVAVLPPQVRLPPADRAVARGDAAGRRDRESGPGGSRRGECSPCVTTTGVSASDVGCWVSLGETTDEVAGVVARTLIPCSKTTQRCTTLHPPDSEGVSR